MARFIVHVDPDSLEMSESGALLGRIFVRLPTGAFPDDAWSDFVVIVAHWLSTAVGLRSGQTDRGILGFMDGPYQLRIEKEQSGTFAITPEDRRGRSVHVAGEPGVQLSEIIEQLKTAASRVLEQCTLRGIETRDQSEIAEALKRS